jgi:uncharacterized membrane protein YgcG
MDMLLRRLTLTAALGALAVTAVSANAQTDARWRAWTGCWAPVGPQAGLGQTATVCVLPTEKASAIEIVSIVGSVITDRTRVDADGVERNASREGCTGTEKARWSSTGTRVLVTETMACAGGTSRKGTGIMSFDQQYQWLDVRGVTSGTTSGIAVARYQMVTDTAGLPAEVRPALALRGAAANNAILAAAAPLTLADIADVSTSADSGVASAWLVERTRGLTLNLGAKQLVALADQGVPPAVIDVLVAIAHPKVFALEASQPQMREPLPSTGSNDNYWRRYPSFSSIYYSPWYDPWYGYSMSSYGYFGYSPYRYSPYGYNPYGYNQYGYYPSGPIIVVNRPSEEPARPHGRVVRGRGYTSGSSGGSSSTTSSGGGSSGGSSSSGSGSTGSGSTGGSGGSAGTSSGGGGDRVAVRKPPA